MKQSKGRHSPVRLFLLAVCLVLFAVSVGYLGYKAYQGYRNEQRYDNLARPGQSESSSSSSLPNEGKFASLLEQNPDTVGWLTIPGTTVDYPVAQTEDNDHYLHYDFLGESSPYGSLFVDCRDDLADTKGNTIIYGHNLNNPQMFGALMDYKNLEFYQQHPVLQFDTLYGDGTYKIVAMFLMDDNESVDVFDYHNRHNFNSEADAVDFLTQVERRTLIQTGVDVQPGDELLTLSTCSYEFTDARFVVVARALRPGESAEVDSSQAVKNPDPLMPTIWYETYGGTKPVFS